jgi:hypothetical protein
MKYKTQKHKNPKLSSSNIALVWLAIWFPTFPLFLGTAGQMMSLGVTSFIFIIYMLFSPRHGLRFFGYSFFILFYVYFFLTAWFSAVQDVVRFGPNIVYVFEVLKYLLYALIFFWFCSLKVTSVQEIQSVFKSYFLLFILLGIWGVLEVMGPSEFKDLAYFLYKREYKEIIRNKAVGPFGITYYYSFIMLLPLSVAYAKFLFGDAPLKSFFVTLFFALSVLLSQSRSSFIGLVIIFIVYSFFPLSYKLGKGGKVVFVYLSFVSLIAFFVYLFWEDLILGFSYTYSGISRMMGGSISEAIDSVGSISVRLDQFLWAVKDSGVLIFTGGGLGKDLVPLESVYALYIYRHGIFGLIFFALFLLKVVQCFYRCSKISLKLGYIGLASTFMGGAVFFLISPIPLISSASQDSAKIAFLFYATCGFVFACHRHLKGALYKLQKSATIY